MPSPTFADSSSSNLEALNNCFALARNLTSLPASIDDDAISAEPPSAASGPFQTPSTPFALAGAASGATHPAKGPDSCRFVGLWLRRSTPRLDRRQQCCS